ncbi:hypothetical protein SLEP1_g40418 [Rubroshorea leprosula]|uniref:HMG box domain-containing protein n=1 Tax=Rubroshorea leprosula TaxID=152421 RepID=A0AAV5L3C3_9ROSI|nr:hypothetical protein SLEP1_g40418 [Rubroshorea leprosula]
MQERPEMNNSTLNALISVKWKELNEEETQVWNSKAVEAMEAYRKELEEYNKPAASVVMEARSNLSSSSSFFSEASLILLTKCSNLIERLDCKKNSSSLLLHGATLEESCSACSHLLKKYLIELFDGKNDFALWQSTMKDVLTCQGLDTALEETKPAEVTQVMNARDILEEEKKALLFLASLPKSYKSLVQSMLVGKTALVRKDATTMVLENNKFLKEDDGANQNNTLVMEQSWGRSYGRGEWCKVYKGGRLVLCARKNKYNIYVLKQHPERGLNKTMRKMLWKPKGIMVDDKEINKTKKKVSLKNEVMFDVGLRRNSNPSLGFSSSAYISLSASLADPKTRKCRNLRKQTLSRSPDSNPTLEQPLFSNQKVKDSNDGKWWHAGFHLTTAIVGPTVLTLSYVFRGLGWGLGFFCLTAMGCVTFYSYYLLSKVLDHCEKAGRRHIRFRELAADVLGSGWMFYFVIFIQTAINTGLGIGAILLAGECLQIMYSNLAPSGSLKLCEFIAMVTVVMILLSQFPTFHSLRYINLVSLLLSLGYTFLVVGACIHAGLSKNAPPRDYSLEASSSARVFSAFTSISILAAIFGNGILPEIQATIAPPATGKMVKGLAMCYTVIFVTFYLAAFSGYWAFGNKAYSNILKNLMLDDGPSLALTIVVGLAVVFVLLQLFAIGLVYSQVAYEIMEKQSADVNQGMFSKRNLIPRVILRTLYMIFCGFVAAMLPFFGDISGVVGAIGFIPLDFVLPMLLYNMTYKPPKSSCTYWINIFIIIAFTGVGILGSFTSIRKLVLDAKNFKLFNSKVVD